MLQNIEITNFKGIKHLKVDKFNQITIIGGKNNTGKTSILRAIKYLFYSNSSGKMSVDLLQEFYNLNLDKDILFQGNYKFKDRDKNYKKVIIETNIDYFINDEEEVEEFTNDFKYSCIYENSTPYNPDLVYILSTNQEKEYKKAFKKFNEIFKQKKEHQIIEYMQIIEPNIIGLTIIENNLYIDYSHKEIRLPANLSGEGLLRLFNIAVAIATSQNGIVLIDEFENGLHWSTLTKIWEFIVTASKKFNCQIICTTHSYELLKYANDVIQNFEEEIDFGYIRLSKNEEELKAYHFDKELINEAILSELEVR